MTALWWQNKVAAASAKKTVLILMQRDLALSPVAEPTNPASDVGLNADFRGSKPDDGNRCKAVLSPRASKDRIGPQAATHRAVGTSPLIRACQQSSSSQSSLKMSDVRRECQSLRRRGSSRERFHHLVSDVHRWRSHNGILQYQVVLFLLEDLPDRTVCQVP